MPQRSMDPHKATTRRYPPINKHGSAQADFGTLLFPCEACRIPYPPSPKRGARAAKNVLNSWPSMRSIRQATGGCGMPSGDGERRRTHKSTKQIAELLLASSRSCIRFSTPASSRRHCMAGSFWLTWCDISHAVRCEPD